MQFADPPAESDFAEQLTFGIDHRLMSSTVANPDGLLHVAATGFGGVVIYDLSGGDAENIGVLQPFPRTEGLLAHSNGRIYVMASGTGQLVSVKGEQVVSITGGLSGAHDVAEAPDGTVWVADNQRSRLVQFSAYLDQLRVLEGPQFGFVGPRYMDFDDDGLLYVADQDAHRVLKIALISNEVLGVIGTGVPGDGPNMLDDPEGVAVRGSEYFFSDSDNNRIVKYVVVLNSNSRFAPRPVSIFAAQYPNKGPNFDPEVPIPKLSICLLSVS